ncbi:hypothetical protein P790_2520 [Enterococcus faecalis NJ44]|nr:hypothetical protein P790_2520 [Enterococcus faecalis NJ44]
MTTTGKKLLTSIYTDNKLMTVEKIFFSDLSNQLTEEMIENFSWNWRINQGVEN